MVVRISLKSTQEAQHWFSKEIMSADNTLRTPSRPEEPVPLPEYPRPQMKRAAWWNLNGLWEYAILPEEAPAPRECEGRILVPYAVESALSGVQRPLRPDQRLWYRRTFDSPQQVGMRVLLHFGAVDYECSVWVNGTHAGGHRGGYLPFTFDISGMLKEGENELVVSVWDPTDTGMQQRGKQVLEPGTIWYTAVSGIWQTVWLEAVPVTSIDSLRLTPDLEGQSLAVEVRIRGAAESARVEVEAFSEEEKIASAQGPAQESLHLPVPNPRAWSLEDPHLYDLRV